MPLTCTRCDNRCLAPPSTRWLYVCPRCGEFLPRLRESERPRTLLAWIWIGRKQWLRAAMLLMLLGALTAAVRAGLIGYRAAASVQEDNTPRPLVVRINAPERQRYDY